MYIYQHTPFATVTVPALIVLRYMMSSFHLWQLVAVNELLNRLCIGSMNSVGLYQILLG